MAWAMAIGGMLYSPHTFLWTLMVSEPFSVLELQPLQFRPATSVTRMQIRYRLTTGERLFEEPVVEMWGIEDAAGECQAREGERCQAAPVVFAHEKRWHLAEVASLDSSELLTLEELVQQLGHSLTLGISQACAGDRPAATRDRGCEFLYSPGCADLDGQPFVCITTWRFIGWEQNRCSSRPRPPLVALCEVVHSGMPAELRTPVGFPGRTLDRAPRRQPSTSDDVDGERR